MCILYQPVDIKVDIKLNVLCFETFHLLYIPRDASHIQQNNCYDHYVKQNRCSRFLTTIPLEL